MPTPPGRGARRNCVHYDRDPLRMSAPIDRLSPRQRACLELVWTRQATSKEIAQALNITKTTVDSYIAEAVATLGARDRRDAAAIAFGPRPRAESGADAARVAPTVEMVAADAASTDASPASRPWRSRGQSNTLTLAQTLGWIAAIAIGSLGALALATSVATGLPPVLKPVVEGVRRLTQ